MPRSRARRYECRVCLDEFPRNQGVLCSGTEQHFCCSACFSRFAIIEGQSLEHRYNEHISETTSLDTNPYGDPDSFDSSISCVERCGCFIGDKQLAQCLPEDTYDDIMANKMNVIRLQEQTKFNERVEEEIARRRACTSLTVVQLKNLGLRNPRMCPRCSTGPVEFSGCADLRSHNRVTRQGSTNACRRCGFFSSEVSHWPAWDGKLRSETEMSFWYWWLVLKPMAFSGAIVAAAVSIWRGAPILRSGFWWTVWATQGLAKVSLVIIRWAAYLSLLGIKAVLTIGSSFLFVLLKWTLSAVWTLPFQGWILLVALLLFYVWPGPDLRDGYNWQTAVVRPVDRFVYDFRWFCNETRSHLTQAIKDFSSAGRAAASAGRAQAEAACDRLRRFCDRTVNTASNIGSQARIHLQRVID